MFGPTTGDRVRLGDTDLVIEVESDRTVYGDEVKFGGGGVPADEILAETNECKPDALCMFSSAPCDFSPMGRK
mgnify:CR=1 FL=1